MDSHFAFAGFIYDADRGELDRAGKVSRLRPQSAAVLAYLLERPRRIVGKDELLRDVWPNLVVTENSLVQCIREIRREMADEAGSILRTAPRRGYALEADVSRPAPRASPPAIEAAASRSRSLSLIVMPLANAGGDPGQAYFADAITDDLTTELGRIPEALVISRSTAYAYRDKARDVRDLGRDIGVRYVVEGSVRKGSGGVVIHLGLAQTADARQVWAERIEGPLAELERLQRAITGRLANALGVELFKAESERMRRTGADVDAQDLAMRAWSLWCANDPTLNLEAKALARRALEIDPDCVRALVTIAHCAITDIVFRTMKSMDDALEEGERAIRRAVALDPRNPTVNAPLGTILTYRGRFEEALGVFDAQLALNANFPFTHAWIGLTKVFMGLPAEAIGHFEHAIQLSPRAPALSTVYRNIAVAHLHAGDDERALEFAERSIRLPNPWTRSYETLAAVYGLAGLIEDARAAVATLLDRWPGYSIAKHREEMVSTRPAFVAQHARLLEGLRRAGLPEE